MGKLAPLPTEADSPIYCPHCSVSLLGPEIPEKYKQEGCGNYYKREIGIEDPLKYDGIWHFKCPNCNNTFGGIENMFHKKGRKNA